jgi:hypothetical protein
LQAFIACSIAGAYIRRGMRPMRPVSSYEYAVEGGYSVEFAGSVESVEQHRMP